jgi:hypothetical protein
MPQRQSGSNRKPLLFGAGGLLIGLVLGAMCGGAIASSGSKAPTTADPVANTAQATPAASTAGAAAKAPATTAAAATTAAPATTAAAAAGPKTSFSDGTYEVNVDIAPGTYKTTVPANSRNCYWQRSKDVSGDFDSIIANANSKSGTPVVVKILKSDAGFTSNGCGTWTKSA